MPSITFKKSVAKDLRKLSKEIRKRIFSKIEEDLRDHPLDHPELKGKFAGLRKYRIGDYRVIYAVLDEQVLITRIAHRKQAYD
jgi:mRNA interferase RelE/StbE